MRSIWLPNIKKFLTGSVVGASAALDVSVVNTVPVPVAFTQYAFMELRFQDAGVTAIPASGGAFIEIGDTNFPASDIANTITELRLNWNGGGALVISKGADATAAALAANRLEVIGSGQTIAIGVSLVATDKIWIRALKNAAITGGELTVTLLG